MGFSKLKENSRDFLSNPTKNSPQNPNQNPNKVQAKTPKPKAKSTKKSEDIKQKEGPSAHVFLLKKNCTVTSSFSKNGT